MSLAIPEILRLYESRGAAQYGSEPVSQLEHALQCAALAEQDGAAPELVVASLLHDLGHLLAEAPHVLGREADDLHQFLAIPFVRGVLPDAALEPIRLHVDAKRYLCCADEGYWATLSAASRHSLELQGGVFSTAQAARFIELPYARDAVALRRWDDLAKAPGKRTPPLAHYAEVLERLATAV
jgi:phosphonate degradation associated HDIG domain protein